VVADSMPGAVLLVFLLVVFKVAFSLVLASILVFLLDRVENVDRF
jgi:hypothetical protein